MHIADRAITASGGVKALELAQAEMSHAEFAEV
jgi:hypothetical protein